MPHTSKPRQATRILAVLGLSLAIALPASAGTALLTSVEELTRVSDAVVRGVVEGREPRYTPDRKLIYTFVEIRSAEVWRGSAPPRLTVRVPGGEIGDIGMKVAGAATFTAGEEVVVFLQRSGDVHQVAGLAQGKFVVAGGAAQPDLVGLHLVEHTLAPGERRAESMPLAELERRVRSVP